MVRECSDRHHTCSLNTHLSANQTGDGHFSPIGGYDPENDLLLIMDVARFKVRELIVSGLGMANN